MGNNNDIISLIFPDVKSTSDRIFLIKENRRYSVLSQLALDLTLSIGGLCVIYDEMLELVLTSPYERDMVKLTELKNKSLKQISIAIVRAIRLLASVEMSYEDILTYYDEYCKQMGVSSEFVEDGEMVSSSLGIATIVTTRVIMYTAFNKRISISNKNHINSVAWEMIKDITYLDKARDTKEYQKIAMSLWLGLWIIVGTSYEPSKKSLIEENLTELKTNNYI